MVALGFPKASEWPTDKLQERLLMVPEKVSADDVPEEFQNAYNALKEKGEAALDFSEEEGKEEKPAKGKGNKEGSVDVESLDLGQLRSLVEERKLNVPKAALKNVEQLRVYVRKALKNPKRSAVDRAVDAAAKRAKNQKPDKKKSGKAPRDADEEEGGTGGPIRTKVMAALTTEWKSDVEVAEEAGVTLRQARSRLRRAKRKGEIEGERIIRYRLPGKNK